MALACCCYAKGVWPPPIAIGRGYDFLVIERGGPPGARYSDEVDVLAHNIWIGG